MNRFVYRWPFFFWLSVLLAFAAFFAIKSSVVATSKGEELHDLIESSPRKIRKEHRREKRELTNQTREIVSKTMYLGDGPLRRLVDMNASRSDIRVVAKKPHMRVVETFYDVTGIMQHELYYVTKDGKEVIYNDDGKLTFRDKLPPSTPIDVSILSPKQHFRYFEAKEAMFDFHTSQLLATDVRFWTFSADGHDVLENPFVLMPEAVGEASKMSFFLSGENNKNNFSAEFLKVQFTPEGGI